MAKLISVPEPTHRTLKALAWSRGKSLSELADTAILEYLQRSGVAAAVLERAQEIATSQARL